MEQTFILRYSNGQQWKTGAPMSKRAVEKLAELLIANGYDVEIVEATKQ